MVRDKEKIPDELTPKDIAMLLFHLDYKKVEEWVAKLTPQDMEDLARMHGWVQFVCTPRKFALIKEQMVKILPRIRTVIEEPLRKRNILE